MNNLKRCSILKEGNTHYSDSSKPLDKLFDDIHIWCKGCGKFTLLEVHDGDLMCADCKLVNASVKIITITKGE